MNEFIEKREMRESTEYYKNGQNSVKRASKLHKQHSNYHAISRSNNADEIQTRHRRMAKKDDIIKSTSIDVLLKPEVEKERTFVKENNYKNFREQYTLDLMQCANQRKMRRKQLEMQMDKNGYSEGKKKMILELFQDMESNFLRLWRSKMTVSMFEFVSMLGNGGYGNVFLVRKKDTKNIYAMKIISKKDSLSKKQIANIKSERGILSEADSVWIVKLYYSFQDKKSLYFILEYLPGGDLMSLLIHKNIFSEEWAKFYISELVLAIEYVHSLKFCHRDIKPDNILIAADGHIKLCDFGLSTEFQLKDDNAEYGRDKKVKRLKKIFSKSTNKKQNRENLLVGTLNYIAPEILTGLNYTNSCDWWSVGIILYEMVFGRTPFYAKTEYETHLKILNWDKYLVFPKYSPVSYMCVKLIWNFCCDANNRLGKFSANEIKFHPFFKNLDWSNLRSVKPPYIPKLSDEADVSHFIYNDKTYIPPNSEDCSEISPEMNFYGFSFKRFFNKTAKMRYMQMLKNMKNIPEI